MLITFDVLFVVALCYMEAKILVVISCGRYQNVAVSVLLTKIEMMNVK